MNARRRFEAAEAVDTLRGEIVSFTRKSLDGWGVGTLATVTGELSIVGKVLGARVGDVVELTGRHKQHKVHGWQFNIVSIVIERPETTDGVAAWLSATLPDVGESRARAIIAHCGGVAHVWEVIEHNPEHLAELPGITLQRAEKIRAAYFEHREHRDALVALRGFGLTTNQIERCKDVWHTYAKAVAMIRNNPYVLAREVTGFGFVRADEIAQRIGIATNAPERIEAGIVHVLDQALMRGHTYVLDGALQRVAADEYLHVTLREVAQGIRAAQRQGLIIRRGRHVYSARMEVSEESAASTLGARAAYTAQPTQPSKETTP